MSDTTTVQIAADATTVVATGSIGPTGPAGAAGATGATGPAGAAGTTLHAALTDLATSGHPISAVTGLQAALDAKVDDSAVVAVLRLEDFGGVADGFWFDDVAYTSGSPTLTSTSTNPFTADMVGKTILVKSAVGGTSALATTVLAYISPTQITLAANPTATGSDQRAMGGTNNATAWSNMLNAAANKATAAKVVLGKGKYFHGSGTTKNLGLLDVRDLVIEGQGYATQLLFGPTSGAAGTDMLCFQNARSLLFEKITFVGLPGTPFYRGLVVDDHHSTVIRDCNFYELASVSQGVVTARVGSLHMENCNFYAVGGTTAGNASAVLMQNWTGATFKRVLFIDHGVLDNALVTSGTGRAWIRCDNTSGTAAMGQSVLTLEDVRMDEGMKSGVQVISSAVRTERVNLRNVRASSGLNMGGAYEAAFELTACSLVVMEDCWGGYPGRPASTPVVKLTDVGACYLRRCEFNETPADQIVVDASTTLHLQDTLYGSISGTPARLTKQDAGVWTNPPTFPDAAFAIAKTAGLQTALDAKVGLTGAETIAGVKTFSSAPIVPPVNGLIIPPTSILTNVGGTGTAWGTADRARFYRFTLHAPHVVRYYLASVGNVSNGNFQGGVVALSGTNHLTATRVMDTGIVACPTVSANFRLDMGATVLPAGDYAQFFWSSSATATFMSGSGSSIAVTRLAASQNTLATGVTATPIVLGAWSETVYISGLGLEGDF